MSPISPRKKNQSRTPSPPKSSKRPVVPERSPAAERDRVLERSLAGTNLENEDLQLQMAMLKGIPDPAWMKDKNGIFLAVNHAWTKFLRKPAKAVLGRSVLEVFGEEIGRRLYLQDLDVIKTGAPRRFEEFFMVDGKPAWIDTIITPYLDSENCAAGTIGVARDITERKQTEERFLRTQRMESLGVLASGIAHDLNNILGPILMATSMLQENIKDEANRELIGIIEEAAQRGTDIVGQVLMFARGAKGQRKTVDTRHLLEQVGRILRKAMPEAVNFVTSLPEDLSNITGDLTQLHRVFMNLCVNARDAMPSGGLLTLSGHNTEVDRAAAKHNPDARPGRYVCITVTDTGIGIPEQIRETIYDPFFTTKEIGKGTGLGLSTVLAIVKNHDGFVTLDSKVGKGSVFSVYLPATQGKAQPEKPQPVTVSPNGEGEVILVVDDELPICKMIETILTKKGYRVLTALGGHEALRLFAGQQGQIRAVLTDLAMPEMSGVELIRRLKAAQPGLPIIASTGQSSEQRYSDLDTLDVQWRLSKPYGAQQLLAIVREALTSRA
ncbi:MAG: ATP-binding protein [Chthoniobacteraceae bacterium]